MVLCAIVLNSAYDSDKHPIKKPQEHHSHSLPQLLPQQSCLLAPSIPVKLVPLEAPGGKCWSLSLLLG